MMTPADILSLSKLDIPKDARGNILPGQYTVDTTIHIHGSMTVGEDYEQRIVAKADPWALFAALLGHLGTLESVGLDVPRLVAMAEAANPDVIKETKAKADAEMAKVKEATKTQCKGKVTAKLAWEEVVTDVVSVPVSAVPSALLG